jgi:hypothetical protein
MLLVRRDGLPVAPVDIADAAEEYARESGRHATIHFIPIQVERERVIHGTWLVRFSLRADDKRLQLYREGKVGEPPTEDVWLHVPDDAGFGGYRPLNLTELGAGGLRTFLDRGNSWSGRGEFASLEEQTRKASEANDAMRTKLRADQKEENRLEQREKRRHILGIPFLPVLIDLKGSPAHAESGLGGPTTTKEKVS